MHTISELKDRLTPIFQNNHIKQAILFGSYAKQLADTGSDVDILIDSEGRLRGIDFFGVLDEISSVLSVPVDLIERSQVQAGGRIEQEIKEAGVVLYG